MSIIHRLLCNSQHILHNVLAAYPKERFTTNVSIVLIAMLSSLLSRPTLKQTLMTLLLFLMT
jgi:hypothetical protein